MVELKYYIFFLGTGLALLLAVWAAASEKITKWTFALFLLSTVFMIDINFMSHEWYSGSTRGFEFSTTDLLLIVLLGSVLVRHFVNNQSGIQMQWVPMGSIPILVFIAIAALSLSKAERPLYGLFEISKMCKGYLIFWTVSNLAQGADFRRLAFRVICVLAVMEIAYGAFQHYSGIWRIQGTLGHPNSLAMYMNMLLAILLAGAFHMKDWKKQLLLLGLVGGGTAAVILTYSRGGWISLFLAFLGVVFLSLRQGLSIRTLAVMAFASMLLTGIVIDALPGMIDRWKNAHEISLYGRLQMNQSGYLMVAESPWLGVGINNSVVWFTKKERIVDQGRFIGLEWFNRLLGSLQISKERLEKEIEPVLYLKNGILIHNIYIVTAAETGLMGFATFLMIGAQFLFISGKAAIQEQNSESSIWMIGIFGGLLAVTLQGFSEAEVRQTPIFYLLCSLIGILVSARINVQKTQYNSDESKNIIQKETGRVGYA